MSGWQRARLKLTSYQREMLDAVGKGNLVVLTKAVDVAWGTEPEPFDALAHIRDVAAGRK